MQSQRKCFSGKKNISSELGHVYAGHTGTPRTHKRSRRQRFQGAVIKVGIPRNSGLSQWRNLLYPHPKFSLGVVPYTYIGLYSKVGVASKKDDVMCMPIYPGQTVSCTYVQSMNTLFDPSHVVLPIDCTLCQTSRESNLQGR